MIKIVVGSISVDQKEVIKDPATWTPRMVLEEEGISYATGQTAIDGIFLRAGEMDKTFSELNIKDKCYLLVSPKHDNAAKVLCLGTAVVVRSDIPFAVLKDVERYEPEILEDFAYDENGKRRPIFSIGTTEDGAGHLSEYGATFSENGSANGEGVITLSIPATTDRTEYIKKMYGKALICLNEMEKRVAAAYEQQVKGDIETVSRMIEVL